MNSYRKNIHTIFSTIILGGRKSTKILFISYSRWISYTQGFETDTMS